MESALLIYLISCHLQAGRATCAACKRRESGRNSSVWVKITLLPAMNLPTCPSWAHSLCICLVVKQVARPKRLSIIAKTSARCPQSEASAAATRRRRGGDAAATRGGLDLNTSSSTITTFAYKTRPNFHNLFTSHKKAEINVTFLYL